VTDPAGLLGAALLYAGAAFGAVRYAGVPTDSATRALAVGATALAGAAGGFLASRGLDPIPLAVGASAAVGLACAFSAGRTRAVRNVLLAGVAAVVAFALVSQAWSVLGIAALCALAFVPSAIVGHDRIAVSACAALAALVGATFGPAIGFLVLFAGAALAVLLATLRKRRVALTDFLAPIGFCGLAALVAEAALVA